jgi:hypothetical protein
MKISLSAQELRTILHYDPDTGIFTRNGKICGTVEKSGHVSIQINKIRYYAHRLAWLYMTGEWPKDQIDHAPDKTKTNNRFANLREANNSQNQQHKGKLPNNKSGFKGVSWENRAGKWRASISCNKKWKNLGLFENPEDAYKAYCKAAENLHGNFVHL